MYKLISNPYSKNKSIFRISDSAMIPNDPANTDYQAYLIWVAEGNTAEEREGN
jgi:hypothetical protein